MTAPVLADWHRRFRGRLAGSIYAAAPSARTVAAQALSDVGIDVHVDVMAADEGLPVGVTVEELRQIADAVDGSLIGVHLIGSPEFVDAVLPEVLAVRPGVVFLPWDAFTIARVDAVRAAGAAAWVALWQEWDGIGGPSAAPWPTEPDGVLVMLIEPGSQDRCAISRLALVTACADELPVAVDGGVTEAVADLCVSAGAHSIVVGRALLKASNGGK